MAELVGTGCQGTRLQGRDPTDLAPWTYTSKPPSQIRETVAVAQVAGPATAPTQASASTLGAATTCLLGQRSIKGHEAWEAHTELVSVPFPPCGYAMWERVERRWGTEK